MPLTPSDAAYLNHLLDRHLKNQRSWPWMRYFVLLMAAFLILLGIWQFSLAGSIVRSFSDLTAIATSTTKTIDAASTRPVTYRELLQAEDSMAVRAGVEAWVPALTIENYLAGALVIFVGVHLALWVLVKWNHHRRDRILITLLREKCAPELAPAPPTLITSNTPHSPGS
jgi:hypothetical protein